MCICNLFQIWPSEVTLLGEEVVQLKQQLKECEMNREELSAELRVCRKIKVEFGVSGTENCACPHYSMSILCSSDFAYCYNY